MRDLADIYTKRGTPFIAIGSRVAFVAYFAVALLAWRNPLFPRSTLDLLWVGYLLVIYGVAEYAYRRFGQRGIDLTFALPLLLVVYCLNLVSTLLDGQQQLPTLNRAEHFTAFVLATYVVWVFFVKYLPQRVWQEHPYYTGILVLAVTSMLGVGNEIVELVFDVIWGSAHVGTRFDTSLDLLMNTLGSTTFLAVRLILGAAGQTATAVFK